MFQFSKYVRRVKDLESWESWFRSKNIHTEYRSHIIVENGVSILYYALFREGVERKTEPEILYEDRGFQD